MHAETESGFHLGEVIDKDQLACVGLDLDEIPAWLQHRYGRLVTKLALSFNNLREIKNLDGFVNLRELVLDNNEFTSEFEIPKLTNLRSLSINNNKISDLETFIEKLVNNCPNLTYLTMLGNTACPNELVSGKDEKDYQRYRHYVLWRLPKLRFLDSRPVSSQEVAEAKRVGSFARVVKVDVKELEKQSTKQADAAEVFTDSEFYYTPLPSDTAAVGTHRGSIGRSRYVYFGKHSEGNRFIRNRDL
eukprot:Colp12_sorted_trinity150504_noHs@23637